MTTTAKTTERRHIMAGKTLNAYTATVGTSSAIQEVLESKHRARQCTAWVLATSATAAAKALNERGILARGTDMRPAMGNHFDQARQAGLLANPEQAAVIVTTLDSSPDDAIVLVSERGATGVTVVGYWRMDKSVKATWRRIELV
jgi:hypothetical protein